MSESTIKMTLKYNPSTLKVTDKDLEPPEKRVMDILMEEMVESIEADAIRREQAFTAYLKHCEKERREALSCLTEPVCFKSDADKSNKWAPGIVNRIYYGSSGPLNPKVES